MRDRGTRIGVVGLAVLALAAQMVRGQGRFETQIKTVTVVDANGVAVSDARAYRGECLRWDDQAQAVRPIAQAPWRRTDANGAFSFEFVRQGGGRSYFVTDPSFGRMACFFIARKDPNESHTIRLEEPARIRGVIKSKDVALPDIRVKLHYQVGRTLFPLLAADYHFDTPAHELAFDLLCPAGCGLNLQIEPKGAAFTKHQRNREIAALQPGEVLDIGSIELIAVSGHKVLGRPAPELAVGEWVKGEPVTLAELKGKVVLLDFWGLWCGPCRKAMPKLVELHEKYARDGLVVIAMHDASLSGASLLDENQQSLDLSGIPFRVATDAAPEGIGGADLRGKGKTIDAYGVKSFPTLLLIDQEGKIHTAPASEEQLYLLLYGRPMPKPTTLVGRMIAAHPLLFRRIAIGCGLILILAIVLGALWLRKSRIEVREP